VTKIIQLDGKLQHTKEKKAEIIKRFFSAPSVFLNVKNVALRSAMIKRAR
jgi:hypothetical protein